MQIKEPSKIKYFDNQKAWVVSCKNGIFLFDHLFENKLQHIRMDYYSTGMCNFGYIWYTFAGGVSMYTSESGKDIVEISNLEKYKVKNGKRGEISEQKSSDGKQLTIRFKFEKKLYEVPISKSKKKGKGGKKKSKNQKIYKV